MQTLSHQIVNVKIVSHSKLYDSQFFEVHLKITHCQCFQGQGNLWVKGVI